MQKEEHHVIPICMKGSDHESNKEPLTSKEHGTVHKTLNIPHDLIRNFRRKTNDWTVWNWERSSSYHKLRKIYFSNLDMLPDDMVRVHGRSFSKQISRASKQVFALLDDLSTEENNIKLETWLVDYHNTKHMTRSELVENVERKLMNLMKYDRERNDLFLRYYMKNKPTLWTV
jgi:hypothetical protein